MTTKTFPHDIVKHGRLSGLARQEVLPEKAGAKQPTYAGTFRCIGPQCEDTCCGDWDIPVDKITYLKYRQFPVKALGSLVSHFVSASEGNPHDNLYGSIRRKSDGSCPFFGEDRLCGIQKHYGAELLSSTCSVYPRSLAVVDGFLEGSLSLSCPEAARLVLLQENSTQKRGDLFSGQFRTDNVFGLREHHGLDAIVLQIRTLVVDLIRDRSRPIWQRLLMIAALCSRLDGLGDHDLVAAADLLARYRNFVGQGPSSELDLLLRVLQTVWRSPSHSAISGAKTRIVAADSRMSFGILSRELGQPTLEARMKMFIVSDTPARITWNRC